LANLTIIELKWRIERQLSDDPMQMRRLHSFPSTPGCVHFVPLPGVIEIGPFQGPGEIF